MNENKLAQEEQDKTKLKQQAVTRKREVFRLFVPAPLLLLLNFALYEPPPLVNRLPTNAVKNVYHGHCGVRCCQSANRLSTREDLGDGANGRTAAVYKS